MRTTILENYCNIPVLIHLSSDKELNKTINHYPISIRSILTDFLRIGKSISYALSAITDIPDEFKLESLISDERLNSPLINITVDDDIDNTWDWMSDSDSIDDKMLDCCVMELCNKYGDKGIDEFYNRYGNDYSFTELLLGEAILAKLLYQLFSDYDSSDNHESFKSLCKYRSEYITAFVGILLLNPELSTFTIKELIPMITLNVLKYGGDTDDDKGG